MPKHPLHRFQDTDFKHPGNTPSMKWYPAVHSIAAEHPRSIEGACMGDTITIYTPPLPPLTSNLLQSHFKDGVLDLFCTSWVVVSAAWLVMALPPLDLALPVFFWFPSAPKEASESELDVPLSSFGPASGTWAQLLPFQFAMDRQICRRRLFLRGAHFLDKQAQGLSKSPWLPVRRPAAATHALHNHCSQSCAISHGFHRRQLCMLLAKSLLACLAVSSQILLHNSVSGWLAFLRWISRLYFSGTCHFLSRPPSL